MASSGVRGDAGVQLLDPPGDLALVVRADGAIRASASPTALDPALAVELGPNNSYLILENSQLFIKFVPFVADFAQFSIRELKIKTANNEDQVCCGTHRYIGTDAGRGPLTAASIVYAGEDRITVHLEWNDHKNNPSRKIIHEESIYPNGRFMKIDYINVRWGLNIVDLGYPGRSTNGEHVAYGGEDWIRGYVTHDYEPTIGAYYNRFSGDGVFDPPDGGSLNYNGHFIFAVYNPNNGRGFGRVVPIVDVEILKCLLTQNQRIGLEVFPHPFYKAHAPFTGYFYVFTNGVPEMLFAGQQLADGNLGGIPCGDGNCEPGENECLCPDDCGLPPATEVPGSTCDDGIDNDCDGDADCDDADCDVDPLCDPCGDGTCDADEDVCSCPLDCGAPDPAEVPGSTCTDGIDNDCDGDADCDDSDCGAHPGCTPCSAGFCYPADDCLCPPGYWLDTQADSLVEDDTLFNVLDVGGSPAFGTSSTLINIHSHYVGPGVDTLGAYRYSGRMRLSDDRGGIGVTFFSNYPNTDAYYRLRRGDFSGGHAFHIAPHGTEVTTGQTDTGVTPVANIWYHFLIEVEAQAGATLVRAKVWAEGAGEPGAWQVDCSDDSPTRLVSGTVGVWSMAQGIKAWDQLAVVSTANPPEITAWRSVRFHGGPVSAELTIDLDAAATGGAVKSEPRLGGVEKVEVDFAEAVQVIGPLRAEDANTPGTFYPVDGWALSPDGQTLVMTWLPGLPDDACYRIDLGAAVVSQAASLPPGGDADCLLRTMAGDATGDGRTLLNDFGVVKLAVQNGEPVLPTNTRKDINPDGGLLLNDVALVKSNSGNSVDCP